MNKLVIQYKTQEVLTDENILNETANFGKLKRHTNKKHSANINTRTKNKFRKFEENYEQVKDYNTIIKNHRMENNQERKE